MDNFCLIYGDLGAGEITETPASFSELQQRLLTIRDQYRAVLNIPYAVDLVREGTGRLSVGLGDDEWMLFFYSEDGDVVLNSLGNDAAEGTVVFYFGDHTELSRKYLIPFQDALDVIKVWFEEGVLSDIIKWTEEIY